MLHSLWLGMNKVNMLSAITILLQQMLFLWQLKSIEIIGLPQSCDKFGYLPILWMLSDLELWPFNLSE